MPTKIRIKFRILKNLDKNVTKVKHVGERKITLKQVKLLVIMVLLQNYYDHVI